MSMPFQDLEAVKYSDMAAEGDVKGSRRRRILMALAVTPFVAGGVLTALFLLRSSPKETAGSLPEESPPSPSPSSNIRTPASAQTEVPNQSPAPTSGPPDATSKPVPGTVSFQPSRIATVSPSYPPTETSRDPTTSPTSGQSHAPTETTPEPVSSSPSHQPSRKETASPTSTPTERTPDPTDSLTTSPSDAPSEPAPGPGSSSPSEPGRRVTASPTSTPTERTPDPTAFLTTSPSDAPSEPARGPGSSSPSEPGRRVTASPTSTPTERTPDPTASLTTSPSDSPSELAPEAVSSSPSQPRLTVTATPTYKPTERKPFPTTFPTASSSNAPSEPTLEPVSSSPSMKKTPFPTHGPTAVPTSHPTALPTQVGTSFPTASPGDDATAAPTRLAYRPGDLSVFQLDWLLSTGLSVRLLAQTGKKVQYDVGGGTSSITFHVRPDMGATFNDPREGNAGGWILVSNSEVRRPFYLGGVGALTFDSSGRLFDYRMVLEGTTANCGGGRTKWNTWISCEEYRQGMIWEVDPTGERPARNITLGRNDRGLFESFAYDDRHSHYFVTEDHETGPLRRFVPTSRNPSNPQDELHGSGQVTYLRLIPKSDHSGTYGWISNKETAGQNAQAFYPNAEGIDVDGNQLFFISKRLKTMFVLNLDDDTYTSHTTRSGVFDGQPDQLQRIIGDTDDKLLYFTEDGNDNAGIHARDRNGDFFTIVEAPRSCNETTGLAFSPNGLYMYVADQINGKLYEFSRDDRLPFHGRTLNIQYHAKT